MAEQINAVIVQGQQEIFSDLEQVLQSLGIRVVRSKNCRETSLILERLVDIDLVFTGTALPDGSWVDVLEQTRRLSHFVPLIVVSPVADVGLYVDALGKGAFEYITSPILASDLAHIIRSAIYKELVNAKQNLSAPLPA